MQPITGVVQHYPWGDQRFIPELFGRRPDGTPWAELWLGTHPSGMSRLADGRDLTAAYRHAPLPAEGLGRGPAALAADPSQRRTGPGGVPRRSLPRSLSEARAAVRPHRVRSVLRRPPGRRDDRPARRARPTPLRHRLRVVGGRRDDRRPAPAQGRRRADHRGLRHEQPSRVALGRGAGRALPGRSERRRHAAAQLRPARTRRGDPARSRQSALLSGWGGRRVDGGQRQRRAGWVDDEADRRRHGARRDGPDATARPGDVGDAGLSARRHLDPPASPPRSRRAPSQDPRAGDRRSRPGGLPRPRRSSRDRRRRDRLRRDA